MSEDRFQAVVRECEIIRDRLSELDPMGNYPLLRRRDLGLSEADTTAEQFTAWRDYLAGRYQVQSERAASRERASAASRRGLSRFLSGESLDSIAAANASDPESSAELHAANFQRRQEEREAERAHVSERQARK